LIIPAIVALFTYVYWRLHQVYELFQPFTIYAAIALLVLGLLLDVGTGTIRFRGSPLLALLGAFVVWCVVTVAIKAPDRVSEQIIPLVTAMVGFVAVSEGIQSLRGLGVIAGVLVLFSIALASLGVHQGLQPTMCYQRQAANDLMYDASKEIPDGRSCTEPWDCVRGGIPDAEYNCEHAGLLDTHSIGGRVRYRGILEDPNELSWALSMALPLAFALYERRRTSRRLFVMIATVVLCVICVIFTQSRSGQLGMLATFGVYFVRRFGLRGALAGALVAIPLVILGGRTGEGAESSSEERLGCWSEALSMWRENPLLGVGYGQFGEHYYLTAHNSFLLTLAELGPLGLLLFSGALYYTIKITIRAQIELAGRPDAAAARTWATAMLASQAGLFVSVMFLTLTYHTILWIQVGLVGSLYAAIRVHEPNFRVRMGWKDFAFVAALDAAFIIAVMLVLRFKY
jgi:hypothetical protein